MQFIPETLILCSGDTPFLKIDGHFLLTLQLFFHVEVGRQGESGRKVPALVNRRAPLGS